MISITVRSSERSYFNYIGMLSRHDQSDCVFSNQKKPKCIYKCCNMGT